MYSTLKRLYDSGKLNEQGLDNAVAKGWIEEDEKQKIMAL